MRLSRRARAGVWQKHDLSRTQNKKKHAKKVLAEKELRDDWLGCGLEQVLDSLVDCFYAHSVQAEYIDAPISARLWTLDNAIVDVRVSQPVTKRLLVEVILVSGHPIDVSTLSRDIVRAAAGSLDIREVIREQSRDEMVEWWKNNQNVDESSTAVAEFSRLVQEGVGHRTGKNLSKTMEAIDMSLGSTESQGVEHGMQQLLDMSDYLDAAELKGVARAILVGDVPSDIQDVSSRIRESLLSLIHIPKHDSIGKGEGLSKRSAAGVTVRREFLTVLALRCFLNLTFTERIAESFLLVSGDFVELLLDLIGNSAAEKHVGYLAARTLNHLLVYKSTVIPQPTKSFYDRVEVALKVGSISHCLLEKECLKLIKSMSDRGAPTETTGPPVPRQFRDDGKSRSISDGSGASNSSGGTQSSDGSTLSHSALAPPLKPC